MFGFIQSFKDNFNNEKKTSNQILLTQTIDNLASDDMKGSIRFRTDRKIYEARLRIKGKQKSVYAKTKKEITKKLRELNNKINAKAEIKDKSNYLYEWLEFWVDTYKKPKLKEKSLYEIQNCIKNHIKPNIDNINLNKLQAVDIDIALNKVKTSRMRLYTYQVYKDALQQAFKNKILKNNIASNIEPVTHQRKKGVALTIEQQQQFINILKGHKHENLFLFYLNSGLRKNELLNLKWSDIDFDNDIIKIYGTKTKNAIRIIPLFENLKKIINKLDRKNDKLFTLSSERTQRVFADIRKNLDFHFTIHSLRHTFATRCLESGINIKTVQKWLGHAKMETTASIYTHIQNDYEKQQASLFNLHPKQQ